MKTHAKPLAPHDARLAEVVPEVRRGLLPEVEPPPLRREVDALRQRVVPLAASAVGQSHASRVAEGETRVAGVLKGHADQVS